MTPKKFYRRPDTLSSQFRCFACLFSQLDDEKEKNADDALMQELEMELDEMDKEFLKQYQEKRLEELRKTYEAMWVLR